MLCIGDLNARIGDLHSTQERITYKKNPDGVRNQNGKTLLELLSEHKKFHVLNGICSEFLKCPSEFSFFRGTVCSQNDMCITNDLDIIEDFSFLKKLPFSDHKPMKLTVKGETITSLEMINECAMNTFSHDHYDINRKLPLPMKLSKINVVELIKNLESFANAMHQTINNGNHANSVNDICNSITKGIYTAAKKSRARTDPALNLALIPNNETCDNYNYKAIAEANLNMYQHAVMKGEPPEAYKVYSDTWIIANELAYSCIKKIFDSNIHKRWIYLKNSDPKQMWKQIDWKGKRIEPKSENLSATTINKYFSNIFNSTKIVESPKITDMDDLIANCTRVIPDLNREPCIDELNFAIMKLGSGISLDGIDPGIMKFYHLI